MLFICEAALDWSPRIDMADLGRGPLAALDGARTAAKPLVKGCAYPPDLRFVVLYALGPRGASGGGILPELDASG